MVLKKRVKFTGSCLKQSKISYTHGKVVNIYFGYKLGSSRSHNNDPTLKNCLFDAVTLIIPFIEEEVFHFQVVDLVKMY